VARLIVSSKPQLLQLKQHHITCSQTENLLLSVYFLKNARPSALFGLLSPRFSCPRMHHLFDSSGLCTPKAP